MRTAEFQRATAQFVKYAISGGVATGVHLAVFYAMALWVLPALAADDPALRLLGLGSPAAVGDAIRARRAAIDTTVAFLISNLVAYLMNIIWVFQRGRHSWAVEIGMFYLVSGISLLIGTVLQTALILQGGVSTTWAFGANVVVSLAINFAVRKFWIFKG